MSGILMGAFMTLGGASTFTLNIATNSVNPNIRTLATAAGWNGVSKLIVNVTAALINRLNTGSTAFVGGLEIVFAPGTFLGSDGNAALTAQVLVTVDNGGTIAGIGGSGGKGETFYYNNGSVQYVEGGAGGEGQRFATNGTAILAAQAGANGQTVNFDGFHTATGGKGGSGGSWGSQGANGAAGVDNSGGIVLGTTGSTAAGVEGIAISGNSNITWKNTGTRLGRII